MSKLVHRIMIAFAQLLFAPLLRLTFLGFGESLRGMNWNGCRIKFQIRTS